MGLRHGVYVSGQEGHAVRAYLHKPSETVLARWDAVAADGTVQIDTGLVWWDLPSARKLVGLCQSAAVTAFLGPLDRAADASPAQVSTGSPASGLNLYGDLLVASGRVYHVPPTIWPITSDGPIVPGLFFQRRARLFGGAHCAARPLPWNACSLPSSSISAPAPNIGKWQGRTRRSPSFAVGCHRLRDG